MFLRCQTQWNYAGDPPGHTGLDLAAVTSVMQATGIRKRDRAEILSRVQVIEMEALRILSRQRSAEIARVRRQQASSSRARR